MIRDKNGRSVDVVWTLRQRGEDCQIRVHTKNCYSPDAHGVMVGGWITGQRGSLSTCCQMDLERRLRDGFSVPPIFYGQCVNNELSAQCDLCEMVDPIARIIAAKPSWYWPQGRWYA